MCLNIQFDRIRRYRISLTATRHKWNFFLKIMVNVIELKLYALLFIEMKNILSNEEQYWMPGLQLSTINLVYWSADRIL